MEDLHIAQCGVKDCEDEHTYVSEKLATKQLMEHLKTKHNADINPRRPSTVFFGWVFPLPERRGSTSSKRGGDTTSV